MSTVVGAGGCVIYPPPLYCCLEQALVAELIYMTLQTQIHSRNSLKLFCLIVHTDMLLLLYGAPGRFVERRHTNRTLYCIVLH